MDHSPSRDSQSQGTTIEGSECEPFDRYNGFGTSPRSASAKSSKRLGENDLWSSASPNNDSNKKNKLQENDDPPLPSDDSPLAIVKQADGSSDAASIAATARFNIPRFEIPLPPYELKFILGLSSTTDPSSIERSQKLTLNTVPVDAIVEPFVQAAVMNAFEGDLEEYQARQFGQGDEYAYPRHYVFYLGGEAVCRTPLHGLTLKRTLDQAFRDDELGTSSVLLSRKLYPYTKIDGAYFGKLFMGVLHVSRKDFSLRHDNIGWIGEGLEHTQSAVEEWKRRHESTPHFSGLSPADYSADTIESLRHIVHLDNPRGMNFLQSLTPQQYSLLNALRRAARNLEADDVRSQGEEGGYNYVSYNPTQTSAATVDVVDTFGRALGNSSDFVEGYILSYTHDLTRVTSYNKQDLKDLSMIVQQRTVYFGSGSPFPVNIVCHKGKSQKASFTDQLRILVAVLRLSFSARNASELRDVLSEIYWRAMKTKRSEVVHDALTWLPSARDETCDIILSWLDSEAFPPRPLCCRFGCNHISVPTGSNSRYDAVTCNQEECARQCAYHMNGVRCTANRAVVGQIFCGKYGKWCTTLNQGLSWNEFGAHVKERRGNGEIFA